MSSPITRARVAAGIIGLMALGAATTHVSAAGLVGSDVAVRYGDLNLGTRTGAETLYARIQAAAAQVCAPSDSAPMVMHQAFLRCENELVARTVASVRSPQLAAVYESHHSVRRPV